MDIRIDVFQVTGELEIVAGRPRGRLFLSKLITSVEPRPDPQPIFLDFGRIQVATASFLREGVIGFRDYSMNAGLNLLPVVSNPNRDIVDELELLLEQCGTAIPICCLDANGKITESRIIGVLEEKQQITLDAVLREKETDASKLEEMYRDSERIKTTGWNNRLSSLASKGLLMEVKRGRGKAYRPVLEID